MKEAEQNEPSLIVNVIFLLIGISLAAYGWIAWGWTAVDSSDWPQTKGVITKSRDAGDFLDLLYVYRVDGTEYSSNRIDYSDGRRSSLNSSKESERYPEGKEVTVYYDPSKPSRAVLAEESSNQYGKLAIIFGVLLASFPACGMLKRFVR